MKPLHLCAVKFHRLKTVKFLHKFCLKCFAIYGTLVLIMHVTALLEYIQTLIISIMQDYWRQYICMYVYNIIYITGKFSGWLYYDCSIRIHISFANTYIITIMQDYWSTNIYVYMYVYHIAGKFSGGEVVLGSPTSYNPNTKLSVSFIHYIFCQMLEKCEFIQHIFVLPNFPTMWNV